MRVKGGRGGGERSGGEEGTVRCPPHTSSASCAAPVLGSTAATAASDWRRCSIAFCFAVLDWASTWSERGGGAGAKEEECGDFEIRTE